MINPAARQGFSSCTFNMKLLLGDSLMMNLVVSHFADLRILVSLCVLTMCAPPKKHGISECFERSQTPAYKNRSNPYCLEKVLHDSVGG